MPKDLVIGRAGRGGQAQRPAPSQIEQGKAKKSKAFRLPYFVLGYALAYVPASFIMPRVYAVLAGCLLGVLSILFSSIEVSE